MATAPDILGNPAVRSAAWRVSVEQYHQLSELGVVPEKTELIRGVVIGKMTKSPLHSWLSQRLGDWLRNHLSDGYVVRQEQPLTLPDSEPEPDLAVVSAGDYRTSHPLSADLVIEIAISSEGLDREKAAIYAGAEIPEYWLFLPSQSSVVVYQSPKLGSYETVKTLSPSDQLKLPMDPHAEWLISELYEADA